MGVTHNQCSIKLIMMFFIIAPGGITKLLLYIVPGFSVIVLIIIGSLIIGGSILGPCTRHKRRPVNADAAKHKKEDLEIQRSDPTRQQQGLGNDVRLEQRMSIPGDLINQQRSIGNVFNDPNIPRHQTSTPSVGDNIRHQQSRATVDYGELMHRQRSAVGDDIRHQRSRAATVFGDPIRHHRSASTYDDYRQRATLNRISSSSSSASSSDSSYSDGYR